jgi:hypothetical protein
MDGEMSTYYTIWINQLATRDAAVERMAIMAVAVVLAWVLAESQYRAGWKWMRPVYVAGGLVMYLVTILVAVRGG